MYPIIEPPPNLILELDVNTLSYSDFQFIHSDDMHHLQDYFYSLDGFVKAVNIIKMKRIDDIAKGIKYNKESCEQHSCCITFEDFEEGQDITQLPCKHIFDPQAINTWLKEESNKCPVCT